MLPYSPDRRTALVFSGSGAAGLYHAGVLRAVEEAGVKVDVVAGHGAGAASAALAAVDGAAQLTGPDGLWGRASRAGLYGWTRTVRALGWVAAALAALCVAPVILIGTALVAYPVGFLAALVHDEAGAAIVRGYGGWLQSFFAPSGLPLVLPRLAFLVMAGLLAVLVAATVRRPPSRRLQGLVARWWGLVGGPVDAAAARTHVTDALWDVVRGSGAGGPAEGGRVFADALRDNLGHPGFRELMIVVSDLDARRDVVAGLLRPPFHAAFTAARADVDRAAEIIDLAGSGKALALDIVGAALTLPGVCDPQVVTFGLDSYWQGEAHRMCDRPGALVRLLAELGEAGVTQVVLVSPTAPGGGPHRLAPPRLDPRGRLGDVLRTAEASALRDAVELLGGRFDALHVIAPEHNPLGPFDVAGAYDELSRRHYAPEELMRRGYEDAGRQFIEPVVGASGEHLGHPARG
ncbi:MAG: patatin-like phospholipase family protein [Vicinamibacterales bacterium]